MVPKIYTSPHLGREGYPPIHELPTDMLVLTRFQEMELGSGPQSVDQALGGLISRKMKAHRFKGDLGKFLLIEIDSASYPQCPQRYILLVGLGGVNQFDGCAARHAFSLMLQQALERKVKHVTMPFNPLTGLQINLRGVSHILNKVVTTKLASLDEGTDLAEIEIYCTPWARRHIQSGLDAPISMAPCCSPDTK